MSIVEILTILENLMPEIETYLEEETPHSDLGDHPFPIQAFPPIIREPITEFSEHASLPIAIAAHSVMGILSLVYQGRYMVYLPYGELRPVGLFLLLLALSGERKTTCDSHFSKAIREAATELGLEMRDDIANLTAMRVSWEVRLEQLKSQMKKAKSEASGSTKPSTEKASPAKVTHSSEQLQQMYQEELMREPPKIHKPSFFTEDVTQEGLAGGLEQWPSQSLTTSEGGMLLGCYGLREENAMATLGFLNNLWDGKEYQTQRKSVHPIRLKDARITISIMIQPGPFYEFLRKNKDLARNIGFLSRCLIAFPKTTQGSRFLNYEKIRNLKLFPKLEVLNNILRTEIQRGLDFGPVEGLRFQTVFFEQEAAREWVNIYNRVEAELAEGGILSDYRDFASKAAENTGRLGALFALVEGRTTITLKDVRGAGAVVLWHLAETRKVFSGSNPADSDGDAANLLKWIVEKRPDDFTRSQVKREISSRRLRIPAIRDAALGLLQRTGMVEMVNKSHYRLAVPKACYSAILGQYRANLYKFYELDNLCSECADVLPDADQETSEMNQFDFLISDSTPTEDGKDEDLAKDSI